MGVIAVQDWEIDRSFVPDLSSIMNICILASRISGNDGVSIECHHWKKILVNMGHKVTFLAGKLDGKGILIPELYFKHPLVMEVHDKLIYKKYNYRDVKKDIFGIAEIIVKKMRKEFQSRPKPELIVVMNALSLPMNFSLSMAVEKICREMDIPIIARHNDFWWERERYLIPELFPFFKRYFPTNVGNIMHVVINTNARAQLKKRMGIDSVVIADTFDFENKKLIRKDAFCRSFKKDFGIKKGEIVFLQATRVVPRKRVELSIELIKKLNLPAYSFIIAGQAGDEGGEYLAKLIKLAKLQKINCRFIGENIGSKRHLPETKHEGGLIKRRIYTLWDAYLNSDVILYPTKIEGFGNQLIEAVFFKKPIILTPYPVYKKDIAPLGFETITISPKISEKTVSRVKKILFDKKKVGKMVEKNFQLGKKYFSYKTTMAKIREVLSFL